MFQTPPFYDIIQNMKKKFFILSSILTAVALNCAVASDFTPYDDALSDTELQLLYDETAHDLADTRSRVEEILCPTKPSESLWTADGSGRVNITTAVMLPRELFAMWQKILMRQKLGDCPFDTVAECKIWRRKPTMRETIIPTESALRDYNMTDILATLDVTGNIDTNSPVAAPLIDRYKMLMRAANVCCTDGMVYSLRRAGASDGLVYKFMVDDANFYGIGERCLMMTDADLDANFPDEPSTVATVSDVRNRCLCQGRQQFYDILAPFTAVWDANPEFAASPFMWTYTDGLNRTVTVSINRDVQNVLNQLEQCP